MTTLTAPRSREQRDPKSTATAATRIATQPAQRPLAYFFIRHQGRWVKIRVRDIHYLEARKNYCKIAAKTGACLTIVTLKRMAEILPAAEFCQIHRAFIVAIDWISSFDNTSVYGPDQTLPIGENYRQALKNRFPLIGEIARRSETSE
jgi:DNA-binding LytR/AlgR family response regulator